MSKFEVFDYQTRELYGSYTTHAAARHAVKRCGVSRYAIFCDGEVIECVGERQTGNINAVGGFIDA